MELRPIQSYVFIDLEVTGLPKEEGNRTKITELSLVAVKRKHLLDTKPGDRPRVLQKLTLCVNPGKLINPEATKYSRLSNDLLEYETLFNDKVILMINTFLDLLTPPVCLIAQNGLGFDFPILKAHFVKYNQSFPKNLMCADCYHGFFDIEEGKRKYNENNAEEREINVDNTEEREINENNLMKIREDETSVKLHTQDQSNIMSIRNINETTPIKKGTTVEATENNSSSDCYYRNRHETDTSINCHNLKKARRRLPFTEDKKPKHSYKLGRIYERVLNRSPLNAHEAEYDCLMVLEISVVYSEEFVKWVDKNQVEFELVKPMTIGERL